MTAKASWYRHLEGWQVGVLSIAIALLAALLAVPREVAPDVLPVPYVDRQEQRRQAAEQRQRVKLALSDALPFDVRAVGEYYRRYGRAVADENTETASVLYGELQRSARVARERHGDEPLLRLHAVQTHLFLRALAQWEASGQISPKLSELSGKLVQEATTTGWAVAPHRMLATVAERTTLFRIRWVRLTGLSEVHPFSPTLNEWRTYYRFLLEHPPAGSEPAEPPTLAGRQLKIVRALEKRDPYYPALLAKGVLQYRLGAYGAAADSFRSHLARSPEGAWRLRAQNYLAAALARVRETGQLQ